MKEGLAAKIGNLDVTMQSAMGLVAIGIDTGLTATAVSALFRRTMLKISFQATGRGLIEIITESNSAGNFTLGADILHLAKRVIEATLAEETLTGKFATVFKILKTAGEILSLFGLALDGIAIIYEAIDGANQREEFRKAIIDLCVRRFSTKKIQQLTQTTLSFSSDARATLNYAQSLEELVDEGNLSQDAANEKIRKSLSDVEMKLTEADDDSVYDTLQKQDKLNGAWTNEDPSLQEIKNIIDSDSDKGN
ncbi:hypothetical protein AX17_001663 [Amanita inopinata Kibby_2008]|nr:hypothetical protein AX17_001663 [Amanita inopinata Kibby_2008]